jgi:hypothetical protein
MLLNALAVVVGALVILPNPFFQGLAIALVSRAIASLRISPLAVPLIYSMTHAGYAPAAATAAPDATSDVTP